MADRSHTLLRPVLASLAMTLLAGPLSAQAVPAHVGFESFGSDRVAIDALLDTYTRAVSTKDEALFETLLLNKSIAFSDAETAVQHGAVVGGTQNYEAFRKGVFGGAPFRQVFKDVSVQQNGALAQVSLVFVNTDAAGSASGWKSMQLLKIGGRWKIASEFFS